MEEKIGQSGTAEKKSGKKKWLIVAAVIVIAALAVVLIFALNGSGRDDGVPMGKSSVAETANGEIVTPVGTLTFRTEDASSGDLYSEKFYGSVGKDEVLLFELSVGTGGVGYRLGSAPDENGTMQELWLNIGVIEPESSWTEDQVYQINSMQGCVNDLIEQLRALDGFREDG